MRSHPLALNHSTSKTLFHHSHQTKQFLFHLMVKRIPTRSLGGWPLTSIKRSTRAKEQKRSYNKKCGKLQKQYQYLEKKRPKHEGILSQQIHLHGILNPPPWFTLLSPCFPSFSLSLSHQPFFITLLSCVSLTS